MWACARGHLETAMTLYNWNKGPLHVFNSEGHLPLMVARRHGHHQLADHLEQIDKQNYNSLCLDSDVLSVQQISPSISTTPNVQTVSNLQSNVGQTDFASISAAVTSVPISKDLIESDSVFKTPNQIPEKSQSTGALHGQIPTNSVDSPALSHPLNSFDNITRRQSDQMLSVATNEQSNTSKSSSRLKQRLKKNLSVDIPPYDGNCEPVHFSPTNAYQRPVREANSEPHLSAYAEQLTREQNPMLSGQCQNDLSPDGLMQVEGVDLQENIPSRHQIGHSEVPVNMDTGKYCFILFYLFSNFLWLLTFSL